ncbi:hypothetical protein LCGC14_2096390, partial [marine sediment metagenome]
ITNAIWQAVQAVGGRDRNRVEELSGEIWKLLNRKYEPGGVPSVEHVQDVVEKVLIEQGHAQTAKAYILYRERHKNIREVTQLLRDISMVEDYINEMDWRVRENSNMTYSLQGLNVHITQKVISNYWLNSIYSKEVREAHIKGKFHIHDLGTLGPYCVGWDLQDLLMVGFRGVRGKIESNPANHFDVALMQIVNFLYTLQGEAAGAQAFSNFDTLLAPFIRHDKLDYKEVKQSVQKFLFNMNVPTRVGFQTPFTNITLDLTVPEYLKEQPVIIGGRAGEETYGDFQAEMDLFNRAFAEVMQDGDASGRPFTFPIPTYNITKDFPWHKLEYNAIWEMTAKYGIPYFSNFINSDLKPDDVRSMCCRLRLDKRELKMRGGGLFGSNPLTGSVGVVTINLPRIAFEADSEEEFFAILSSRMELARESLGVKRRVLEEFTDRGLYPYSKFYLRYIKESFDQYWKNHFSTIGIIGMNRDVTELKVAQEALGRERNMLRSIVDTLPEYIFVKDRDSKFVFCNRAVFETIANYSGLNLPNLEDLLGKSDFDIMLAEKAKAYKAEEQEIIRTGRGVVNREDEDEQGRWLSTTKIPWRDDNGEIVGIVGLNRDITARKKTGKALQKAKEQLETKVLERTAELHNTNKRLREEIVEHKRAEKLLSASEKRYRNLVEGLPDVVWAFSEKRGTIYA